MRSWVVHTCAAVAVLPTGECDCRGVKDERGDAGEEGGEGHVENMVAEPCRYRCDAQASRMTEGERQCVMRVVLGVALRTGMVERGRKAGRRMGVGAACGDTNCARCATARGRAHELIWSRRRLGVGAANGRACRVRDAARTRWAEMWMGRALYGLWWQRAVSWPRGNSLCTLDGERRVRIGEQKTANEEWWSGDRERRGWEEERKGRRVYWARVDVSHEQVGRERWTTCYGEGGKRWLGDRIGCAGGGGLRHGDKMRRGVEAAARRVADKKADVAQPLDPRAKVGAGS
ncbi:hypothetical protein B0H14DRAFT_3648860 [Mycena olivaceomarginata]|nr:hypothetical protein B0H14DRAFT_3648860 [Mycena olivaceomarginata]